jgi:hypothetical protein
MIRRLLAELEGGGSAMSVNALALRVGTSPAAVQGALDLLVRKGRIVRGSSAGACDGCAAKAMCNPLLGQTTRYIPVPAGARPLTMMGGAWGEAGWTVAGCAAGPAGAAGPEGAAVAAAEGAAVGAAEGAAVGSAADGRAPVPEAATPG